MSFLDLLRLSLRNLREAKLRAILTTLGVLVGVAVIVTMVSFGLGLQRNTTSRFKELDLFNEITVYGKSLSNLVEEGVGKRPGDPDAGKPPDRKKDDEGPDKPPERSLDDAALAEIAAIPGVDSIEPNIYLNTYVRANGKAKSVVIGGTLVPNAASRFKNFDAGQMISAPEADEAIVDERFLKNFGYAKAEDAVGQKIEFLAPPEKKSSEEEEQPNFFGIPLEDEESNDPSTDALVARSFRVVGVLKNELSGIGKRFRGTMPAYQIYISVQAARLWREEHRDEMSEVALQLARESGALGKDETIGYGTAVVRVNDPVALTDVRNRINALGFGSFSIVDQLEQLRTVFLIMNSALGLLGGISLLVASFGIANTMIMSILERTREIGIMKAIGAEDREIKLIFFVEAGVIGLTGGVLGALAAWGIDGVANRLAYRFVLQPQGASYIDFFAIPPYLWGGAILFAVLVSILAALYPAARAARIDPVKALRHD
ncbi:MAG: ABC transporter permease [Acidobacteria bacterium]|nr:ABC transporter permease [Acidobacteriota bacterium]